MHTVYKLYFRFVYGAIAGFVLALVYSPVMGQVVPKKMVTENYYHLWSTLQPERISDEGHWVSYRKSYESQDDTLFVRNTTKSINYICPKGTAGIFNSERSFAYRKADSLVVLDLTNGNRRIISHVNKFDFSSDGHFLIVSKKLDNGLLKVTIFNESNEILRVINDIISYQFDPTKCRVAYTTLKSGLYDVAIIDLKQKLNHQVIATGLIAPVTTLTWNSFGTALAFYVTPIDSKENGDLLYFYNLNCKLFRCYGKGVKNSVLYNNVDAGNNVRLSISDDGKKVFFGIRGGLKENKGVYEHVEVWRSDDKSLYSPLPINASSHFQSLGVWWPENNSAFPINSIEQSWVTIAGQQQYALVADRLQYEPQYKWIADMDYYIVNFKSGERKLFLAKQSGYNSSVNCSPDGRYIAYYRNKNWWIYHISNGTRFNVTSHIKADWDSQKTDPGNEVQIWGVAGWSTDGNWLLIYDKNDIWAIALNENKSRRLTQGKEQSTKFRFDNVSAYSRITANYSSTSAASYDLTKPLIIKATKAESASSAYCILDFENGISELKLGNYASSNLLLSKNNAAVVYLEQAYDESPRLMFKSKRTASATILTLSNTHQKNFEWGRSKMTNFINKKGDKLNAALFYPAGYIPGHSYPMIVYIYSVVSDAKNEYVNPSKRNVIGFNISNLTAKGYFVLLPDIAYEQGNPGLSATDCVTAAVKKVVDMGLIDPKKIGLIGHSFGGYETNFITTQTNIFAAAVSGSAVSDNVSHYFSINTNSNVGESWRYENQQYRMGKSFYDDKEGYYRNSPILHADNIETPLLTWQGSLDENVQPTQGKEFFLALRRLSKKNVMLVYPDDGHILYNSKNQQDLTTRIEDWFDHYLKGIKPADWMVNKIVGNN